MFAHARGISFEKTGLGRLLWGQLITIIHLACVKMVITIPPSTRTVCLGNFEPNRTLGLLLVHSEAGKVLFQIVQYMEYIDEYIYEYINEHINEHIYEYRYEHIYEYTYDTYK